MNSLEAEIYILKNIINLPLEIGCEFNFNLEGKGFSEEKGFVYQIYADNTQEGISYEIFIACLTCGKGTQLHNSKHTSKISAQSALIEWHQNGPKNWEELNP